MFPSYGVLGWLPDMTRWAQVVAHVVKPGGTFYVVEFHPFAWIFDDAVGLVVARSHTLRTGLTMDTAPTVT